MQLLNSYSSRKSIFSVYTQRYNKKWKKIPYIPGRKGFNPSRRVSMLINLRKHPFQGFCKAINNKAKNEGLIWSCLLKLCVAFHLDRK